MKRRRGQRLGLEGSALLLALAWPVVAGAGPPVDDAAGDGDATVQPDADEAPEPPEPPEPPEDEPQTALEWFDRGMALATAQNFVPAAEAFLRSYELQPTGNAMLNAAYAYEAGNRPREAVTAYRSYLEQPDVNPQLIEEVQTSIDALMPQLAVLKGVRYDSGRPPKRLWVNGVERDLQDFPVLLLPGMVEIEVEDELGERSLERYEIFAGESQLVDARAMMKPPPLPTDTGEPPTDTVEPPSPTVEDRARAQERVAALTRRERRLRTATWVSLGVSGGVGVAILTTGLLALRDLARFEAVTCYDDDDGVCAGAGDPDIPPPGDPQQHRQAYLREQLAANVFIGVGSALAVTTLALGLSSWKIGRDRRRAQARLQSLGLGVAGFRF